MQVPFERWPLTGRREEMQAFATAWADPNITGVVIYGAAGVGKSRLADSFAALAADEGWEEIRATASAAAAALPLGAIAHLLPVEGVDLSDPVRAYRVMAEGLTGGKHQRKWVLWADDLHLLDSASAVLLRQMMDARRLRLVGTVRTGALTSEAVQSLTGGDSIYRIDVSAFSQQQTMEVLQAALGGKVGRRALYELHRISGGNGLYLRELVLGALSAGTLASDGEIWELSDDRPIGTPALVELIEARLDASRPEARPVLELLALCEPIALADAAALAPVEMIAVELEEKGLVEVVPEQRRTVLRLTHPLYGEVLRGQIPPSRRRALLLEQASRVEACGARRRDDALHLATWYLSATGTADSGLLVSAALLARHAHDYDRAVALLRALPEGDHSAQSLMLLGESLLELFENDEADKVLAQAEKFVHTDQEILNLAFMRTMNLFWVTGRTADALSVNTNALKSLSGAEERRMLRLNEGAMRAVSGNPERALELLKDLDSDPAQAPSLALWVVASMMQSAALAVTGRTREAIHEAERAYHLQSQLPEAVVHHPAGQLVSLVLALTEAGQIKEARDLGRSAWETLGKVHNPMNWIWLAYHQGLTELVAGHVEAARRWFAESAAQSRTHHNERALRLALSQLAAAAAASGDLEAAEAAQAEADGHPAMGYRTGEDRLGEAWIHAGRGHLALARAVLSEAAQAARDTGQVTSEGLLLTDIARLGDAAGVQARLAELADQCDGALAAARAGMAAALAANDPDKLLDAAADLEAIGADLLAAEAATAAAAAWRRAGHVRKATAANRLAQTYADRCEGAHTPLLTETEPSAVLTDREREIALLVADGQTSRNIAQTLHLSVRTVDNHLQRIYSKLGLTTRRELSATMGRRR
ncbi:LuxR C-terminal-related transcriptional regulator [Streptomyces sp. NPDC004787]|uniref:LuxR C-terminal-related transcriptional regulator n=1 Tax=Streptomyces sp. NPDC004787 TaxID=3154291 RepID=UPI00339F5841